MKATQKFKRDVDRDEDDFIHFTLDDGTANKLKSQLAAIMTAEVSSQARGSHATTSSASSFTNDVAFDSNHSKPAPLRLSITTNSTNTESDSGLRQSSSPFLSKSSSIRGGTTNPNTKSSQSSIASSFGFMVKQPSSLPMKKSESALGRLLKAMSGPRSAVKQTIHPSTLEKETSASVTKANDMDSDEPSSSSDEEDDEHGRGIPQQEQFVRFWVRQAYESINDPIMVVDSKGDWILFMNSACRSLLHFKQPSSRQGSVDKSTNASSINAHSSGEHMKAHKKRPSQSSIQLSPGIIQVKNCLSYSSALFLSPSLHQQHSTHHHDVQLIHSDGSLVLRKASVGILRKGIKERKRKGSSFSSGDSHHQDEYGYVLTFMSGESPLSGPATPRPSRYETEFEELEKLGKGGFGDVYKARNRLDGQDYAIKKVKLSCHPDQLHGESTNPHCNTGSETGSVSDWGRGHQRKLSAIDNRLVQEAKTFALLSNHPNVVRYYNAWIEPVSSNDKQTNGDGVPMSRNGSHRRTSQRDKQITVTTTVSEHDYTETTTTGDDDDPLYVHNATLYIQMQLYPYHDLRHWLKTRATIDRQANLSIFHQLLSGLSHIHRQNVIHRDVKPENVFMHGLHVYLGDFGLAKSIAEHLFFTDEEMQGVEKSHGFELEDEQVKASGNHGTYFYMAPEILSSQVCTRKSDVYSCGIVLFELFSKFDTAMERAITLTNLKKKHEIPEEFSKEFPDIAHIVGLLLQDDPATRPTAEEILSDLLYMQSISVPHAHPPAVAPVGSHGSATSSADHNYSPPSTATGGAPSGVLQSPMSDGVFFYEDTHAHVYPHQPHMVSSMAILSEETRRSSMESDRSAMSLGRGRQQQSRQGSLSRKATSSVFWHMSNASLPRYPSPNYVRQGSIPSDDHHVHASWIQPPHYISPQPHLSHMESSYPILQEDSTIATQDLPSPTASAQPIPISRINPALVSPPHVYPHIFSSSHVPFGYAPAGYGSSPHHHIPVGVSASYHDHSNAVPYYPHTVPVANVMSFGPGLNTPPSSSKPFGLGLAHPTSVLDDKEKIRVLEADVAALQEKVAALLAEKEALQATQPGQGL